MFRSSRNGFVCPSFPNVTDLFNFFNDSHVTLKKNHYIYWLLNSFFITQFGYLKEKAIEIFRSYPTRFFAGEEDKRLRRIPLKGSSNKCKNYLLKIYSQHINFFNTILNLSLWFISLGDPAIKSPSIPDKFNVKPLKNISCVCSLCFRLTRNVRFSWNMYKFKFNFLSRGQLESLNLDKILLPLLKVLPCYEVFLVT